MNPEELQKGIERLNAQSESRGFRILFTTQCILCNTIIDEPVQAMKHVAKCRIKNMEAQHGIRNNTN